MVGPFMQGILLIGIIYWYSKSMMNMINDYYRSEFQRKVQTESASKSPEETPLNVDNFMEYVREMDAKNQSEVLTVRNTTNSANQFDIGQSYMLQRFMQITGAYSNSHDICRENSSIGLLITMNL
ncbi:hypothetical protein KR222_007511 [Zaprionus bogoriensis]|nr:hypothetical protein KR222_007511 [Zaprionus bogoriensis]